MSSLAGYAYASAAAVAFGLQYVPVKKYEVYDGTTFQWFMCNGILMVASLMAVATGDIERGASPLCMLGGMLWALSNFIVIPLVKLLGIGLGFSLYHFVNLVVGYAVGRFGLFGMPRLSPRAGAFGLLLCDVGCFVLLVGFVIMVFVETGPQPEAGRARAATSPAHMESPFVCTEEEREEVDNLRKKYRQWRVGEAKGMKDRVGNFVVTAAGMRQRGGVRFFNFGMYDEGDVNEDDGMSEVLDFSEERRPGCKDRTSGGALPPLPKANSEPTVVLKTQLLGEKSLKSTGGGRAGARVLGVFLAICGGVLCGVNNVPPSLYTRQHPELSPAAAVFSQCLGIWMTSSAIYIGYSSLAKLVRWPVPHSVIRPAYLSGCIWAVGFPCMLGGIKDLGYSIGYTLDAVGPVVISSLVSIIVYGEIAGMRQLSLFALSFFCQLIGVSLIAVYGQ